MRHACILTISLSKATLEFGPCFLFPFLLHNNITSLKPIIPCSKIEQKGPEKMIKKLSQHLR